ncbi:MAG: hypothetical protein AAFP02_03685 [Bacteroidota bacterium]
MVTSLSEKVDPAKAHILVTGIQHSSTTWVGKTLTASSKIGYVYEPFNVGTKLKSPFRRWYEYVYSGHPDEEAIIRYINSFLSFSPLRLGSTVVQHLQHPVEVFRLLRTQGNLLMGRRQLLKDPIASLSVEWLTQTFGLIPVVLVRHPVAFCASFQKRGHHFPFQDFLSQERLMEDFLSPYEAEINQAIKEDWSSFDEAKLLWKCIYTVLQQQKIAHPEWIYLSNENLSLDARSEYQDLLSKLNIPFDEAVEKEVKASSEASSESWRVRDSKANAFKWKKKFSQEEIDNIRDYMGEIGAYFYDDDFW